MTKRRRISLTILIWTIALGLALAWPTVIGFTSWWQITLTIVASGLTGLVAQLIADWVSEQPPALSPAQLREWAEFVNARGREE